MYTLLRPFLFLLPAELSHQLTLKLLLLAHKLGLLRLMYRDCESIEPVTVMGLTFKNPVGLAAGLDKNGHYIDALAALGFGYIEIGSVTPKPQPGNTKPRLFRLTATQSIINRMGFNNHGVDHLVENVKKMSYQGILGINIGKNVDTPVERAVDDYLICMEKVYNYADYIVVNVSSPNTPGLRSLQYGEELGHLISTLKAKQAELSQHYERYVPIALKVAPDLTHEEIKSIAEVLLKYNVDGLIATNTTLSRALVSAEPLSHEMGGLSGQPLTQSSTDVIKLFYEYLQDEIPIIGVGGIFSGVDACEKMEAGARLLEVYSGLIYKGPNLIQDALRALKIK